MASSDKTGLRHDPRNARRHTERNKAMIRRSLQECGAFRSIGVDGDDVIRAGNGVFEQAQELGLKVRVVEAAPDELIAVKRADLKGEKAQRAALWDNRTNETSEWANTVLAELDDEGTNLSGLWDDDELAEIRELAEAEGQDDLDEEPDELDLKGKSKGRTVKPVLTMEQVRVLETAIARVGVRNRGEALTVICQQYLDSAGIVA